LDLHAASIAFPSINTGTGGIPIPRATRIALTTVCNFIRDFIAIRVDEAYNDEALPARITFVLLAGEADEITAYGDQFE
jgi:O-acetyl-ADP-ribose deacetylase (regulator of RNase III)